MYAHTFTTIANVYSHGFMGRSNAWSPRHAMLCVAASFIDVFWFNVCLRVLRDALFVRDLSMLFVFVVFLVFFVCVFLDLRVKLFERVLRRAFLMCFCLTLVLGICAWDRLVVICRCCLFFVFSFFVFVFMDLRVKLFGRVLRRVFLMCLG